MVDAYVAVAAWAALDAAASVGGWVAAICVSGGVWSAVAGARAHESSYAGVENGSLLPLQASYIRCRS